MAALKRLISAMCKYYRGLYRGFRDTAYLPFYFQGYGILSILLPVIWDTVFNILFTLRDIDWEN